MKLLIAASISAMLLTAGEPQAKKSAKDPAAPPAVSYPATRAEVPKGAVEREPGRFFYTDSEGKKWIYVRTPFGASRIEDKGESTAAPVKSDPFADIKVTESGDTVTFERKAPFGVSKWQKKKSELNSEEQDALRRSKEAPAKQDR